ncbi:maleylacetoacetate isomerase [Natronospira proteinivora]|uniref:Maleylacetoacetate isomerase n=1 Tax=Natronospira proteinivora TaxID=1807133 RepID=A0ABT1G8F7_9GAMM|nr:maleylacetoacetate isomerase [Natronospira proteinivora]MCP1727516.1 maleylacetoacetate isomerase [Natronospira proteinivora]
MKLYTYWRSTAAYRVRIALHLKGIPYEQAPVHLVKDGGEQHQDSYRGLNPQGLVPTLMDGGVVITQSLAILEYLEERHPEPALLPSGAADKARVRGLAQLIACEVHPLNNLRVLQYLSNELRVSDRQKTAWYHHWLAEGLGALETRLANEKDTGDFCHGDQPGLVDLCLVPQLYNARRFEFPLEDYPTLVAIDARCRALNAFRAAAPEAQPDAVN